MNDSNGKQNEKEIRKMIDDFFAALCAKDVKKMMTYYASDVIVYDVKPPFQSKGAVAWRHIWEACIPYFPESFSIEIQDEHIHASDTVAIAHLLFKLTGPEKNHAAMQTWIRTTTGYKKVQGKWKIIHEHGSLPYNPHTMQAMMTPDVNAELPMQSS
jgi:uncharacterized protein (TIGR02246 family)